MIAYPSGATPLDHEEIQGLLHPGVTTRAALDYLEAGNIRRAERWAFSGRHADLVSSQFILSLHARMFGEVWQWAGQYRKTEKNIGVIAWHISTEIYKLCDDVKAQQHHQSYPADEIAARFHHKLVYIHPFPNGNGRLSRIMTDLLLVSMDKQRFSWGSANLNLENDARSKYLDALRAADRHDYKPLLDFVRS